jgi:hypothetical protein
MLRRVFMCKRIEEEVYKPVIGIAINQGIMKPEGSTPTFLTPSRGYSFRSFLRPPRRPRARPPPLCEICQLWMLLGKAACTRLKVSRSAGAYMAFRNDFIKCAIHCADVLGSRGLREESVGDSCCENVTLEAVPVNFLLRLLVNNVAVVSRQEEPQKPR